MPLFDYKCEDCCRVFEVLLREEDTPECPHCDSKRVKRLVSALGGYQINGSNSSSVTPKGAGSFKKK